MYLEQCQVNKSGWWQLCYFFFTLYQMNAKYMSQYCGSQNSGCSLLLYQGHSSLSVSIKDIVQSLASGSIAAHGHILYDSADGCL